jgi:spermidine synthase
VNKIANFLGGVRILEERQSRVNGKLTVVRDFAWGTYIQVKGLTQSGGVVKTVWQFTLKKLSQEEIQNCLILGLGGGTNAKLVRKFWSKAEITGIEINPLFIELGRKYLGLDKTKVKIKIRDAFDFVKKDKQKYDLILVDTYVGDKFPEKFASEEFFRDLKKIVSPQGRIVFNRLYYGEKRPEAMKFSKRLEKAFPKVEAIYPEANVMFICGLDKHGRRSGEQLRPRWA